MNGWSPIGSHRVKQFLSLGFLLRVFLFGTPIVLLFVIITKATRTHPIVFTSLPPPPVVVPYAPEARTSIIGSLHLESAETNRPEIAAAITKITKLEDDLAKLETKVYSTNPALWTYEKYKDVVFNWYDKIPSKMEAWNSFDYPQDKELARRHQKASSEIQALLTLVLSKEILKDPVFGLLQKNTLDAVIKFEPKLINFADGDRIAGYYAHQKSVCRSFEEYTSEVNRRYSTYVSAIDERVRREGMPPEALADIKDYVAKNAISGSITDLYLPLHTPAELVKLRKEIDSLAGELSDSLTKSRSSKD